MIQLSELLALIRSEMQAQNLSITEMEKRTGLSYTVVRLALTKDDRPKVTFDSVNRLLDGVGYELAVKRKDREVVP